MNKVFYPRLAASNIRKNMQVYLPYIITCILSIAMYYIMHSISANTDIMDMGNTGVFLLRILGYGRYIIALFGAIFLFYTNSFLMKRRKQEIGLFHVLGMEKRHILIVIAFETLYIAGISLTAGLLAGILFEKLAYLILLKLVDFDIVFGFHVCKEALLTTLVLFAIVFGLIYIKSALSVVCSKPIELLKGNAVGEREPKAKWALAVLGILCIGSGYYISVTTQNPLRVLGLFALAVLLVIVGTYLLFTTGTITLLKLLKKNRHYYYQTKHFVSVSGMLYRMKRNAVGLANICVLSTMVLVMLSTTISMWFGLEDAIRKMYPSDIMMTVEAEQIPEDLNDAINQCIEEESLEVKQQYAYPYYDFAALKEENVLEADINAFSSVGKSNICYCFLISIDDYNRVSGENIKLQDGESLVYCRQDPFKQDTWKLYDETYQIKEHLQDFIPIYSNSIFTEAYMVMTEADIQRIIETMQANQGDLAGGVSCLEGFDFAGTTQEKHALYQKIEQKFADQGWFEGNYVQLFEQSSIRETFLNAYGGLLFIGIFLGILFTVATILIIYYKQISEGYEDHDRYVIMQKVGMSREEVKASIRSQILTVFFLPLVTATIHVLFAYPVIERLLRMVQLDNRMLFIGCIFGCVLVFGILYACVYAITSRVYYKLVQWS